MRRTLAIGISAMLVLASCGGVRDSRLNPFNWFGQSSAVPVAAEGQAVNPLIPRRNALVSRRSAEIAYAGRPIQDITELNVIRRPGGALVQVTGVADRIGTFDARLIASEAASTDSVLTFSFEVIHPSVRSTGGGVAVREVSAATFLSDQDLRGIDAIRVVAANSARSARR